MSKITGRTSLLQLIERRRDEMGITEAEICRRAGVSPNAIYNIRAYPSRLFNLRTAIALVEALDMELIAQ